MSSSGKPDGWVLCPSKTFPGKLYYFNVSSGETAWTLNEDERKLLKPMIKRDKHSYPEPIGPPMESTPSIFTQHSYRSVNNANRKIFVDVRTYQQPTYQQPTYQQPTYQQPTYQQPTYQQPTLLQPTYQQPTYLQTTYQQPTYQQPTYQQPVYQQPVFGQPAYQQQAEPLKIPDIQIKVPVIVESELRNWVPSFPLNQSDYLEDRTDYQNSKELDRDLFIPKTYTPLSQRFAKYTPVNPEITQRSSCEAENDSEHPKYDSNPVQAVKSLHQDLTHFKTSTPVKNCTPFFPNDQSVIHHRQKDYINQNQPKPAYDLISNVPKPRGNLNLFSTVEDSNQMNLKPITDLVSNMVQTGNNLNIFPVETSYIPKPGLSHIFSKQSKTFEVSQGNIEQPKGKDNAIHSEHFLNIPDDLTTDVVIPTLFQSNIDHQTISRTLSDEVNIDISDIGICKQNSTLNESNKLAPDESLLKNLSENDLRRILMANKKRKMVEPDADKAMEPKMIHTTRQECQSPPKPKKKVTFNIEPERLSAVESIEDSTQDDENNTISEDLGQEISLESPTKRAKPWYIVVDTQVLLEELEFLESFTKRDTNCHIVIPAHVMSDVKHLSKSDSSDRRHVTLARHLMRRLWAPHLQIIVPTASEDMLEMTTEEGILKSCLLAMQDDHVVVLITNDETLQKQADRLEIQCLNVQQIKNCSLEKPEVSFDIKKIKISVSNETDNKASGIPTHVYKELFERTQNNNNLTPDKNIQSECNNNTVKRNPFQKTPTKHLTSYKDNKDENTKSNETKSPFFQNDKKQEKEKIVSSYFQNKDQQSFASLFQKEKENAIKKKMETLVTKAIVHKDPKGFKIDGIEKITEPNPIESDRNRIELHENYKNIKVQFNSTIDKSHSTTDASNIFRNGQEAFPNNKKCDITNRFVSSIFEDLPTKDTTFTAKCKNISKPSFSTTETQSQPSVFGTKQFNKQDAPSKPVCVPNQYKCDLAFQPPISEASKQPIFANLSRCNQDSQPAISKYKNNESKKLQPRFFETEETRNVQSKPSIFGNLNKRNQDRLQSSISQTGKHKNNEIQQPCRPEADETRNVQSKPCIISNLNNCNQDRLRSSISKAGKHKNNEIQQSCSSEADETRNVQSKPCIFGNITKCNQDRLQPYVSSAGKYNNNETQQPYIFETEETRNVQSKPIFGILNKCNQVSQPSISKYKNNVTQQPCIFETEETRNVQMKPSISRTVEIQKPVSSDSTKNVLEELSEILEKNNITEKRVEDRKEEVMCSIKQILEDCLTDILKSSSIPKSPLPWTLREVLHYTEKVYGSHTSIKTALDVMASVLNAKGEVILSVLDSGDAITARDVVNFVGCGFMLLDCLKKIHPNSETLIEAEDSLNEILQNDPNTIVEQVINTPLLSRNTVSNEEKSYRRNFVKKRSEILNYLRKHCTNCVDTLNAAQAACWGQSNKDVKIVRTIGKNLNLLNINKSKDMTVKVDNTKTNNDIIEDTKIGADNRVSAIHKDINDGNIETHAILNKFQEHIVIDESKTVDNVVSVHINEKLTDHKHSELKNTENIKSRNDDQQKIVKNASLKIVRTYENSRLNRSNVTDVRSIQNLEVPKIMNTQIIKENTDENNKKAGPFSNFKLSQNIKLGSQIVQKLKEYTHKDFYTQNISDTKIDTNVMKTDIETIRCIDNVKTNKEIKENSHTSIELNKAGPKRTLKATSLNQETDSNIDNNLQNTDDERQKYHDFTANLQQNITSNAKILRPFNNYELTKELEYETFESIQKALEQVQKEVLNIDETEKIELEKAEPKIVRLISDNTLSQAKDNLPEKENKTDFLVDFPTTGHTFGTNEIAGPKMIRNIKLMKEYEDKIKDRRLSTDLDALDDDFEIYKDIDATNDSSFKSEPNDVSSPIITNNFPTTYATNDFENHIRSDAANHRNHNLTEDKENDKDDAPNYMKNMQNRERHNKNDHRITQDGEHKYYDINENLNKNDATNEIASLETSQAKEVSIASFDSCIANVSSCSAIREDRQTTNENLNDSDAINDGKNDSTHDSGLGNDSQQIHLMVSFLTTLNDTSKRMEHFVKNRLIEIRDKNLRDDKKKKIYENASIAYKSIMKISESLKSLILRESNSATSLSMAFSAADQTAGSYRLVVSSYLHQAQKLLSDLKILLSLTDPSNVDKVHAYRSGRHYSVFDKKYS